MSITVVDVITAPQKIVILRDYVHKTNNNGGLIRLHGAVITSTTVVRDL